MKLSRIQYIELAVLRIILNDDESKMIELWNTITDSSYHKTHHPIELYLSTFPYPENISLTTKIVLQSKSRGITWTEGMLNHLFISGKFHRRFDAADIGVNLGSLIKVFKQIKELLTPVIELNFAEGPKHIFVSATSRTLPLLLEKYADKSDQTFGKMHKPDFNKRTSNEYYANEYGPENWFRKISVDPDEVERFTAGKIFMMMPVHLLLGNPVCLDPSKKERERIYIVEDSPKPYRRFDGTKKKHCSRCPFEDGCMVCTLK